MDTSDYLKIWIICWHVSNAGYLSSTTWIPVHPRPTQVQSLAPIYPYFIFFCLGLEPFGSNLLDRPDNSMSSWRWNLPTTLSLGLCSHFFFKKNRFNLKILRKGRKKIRERIMFSRKNRDFTKAKSAPVHISSGKMLGQYMGSFGPKEHMCTPELIFKNANDYFC